MKKIIGVILFILMIGYFSACTHKEIEKMIPVNIDTTGMDSISYINDIHPIIITYCYGTGNQHCHVINTNQGAIGDFTNYAGLKSKVDNGTLQSRALNAGGGMPPSYTTGPTALTTNEKSKIQNWIDSGAPDN